MSMTCAYYREKLTRALWALRVDGRQIVAAVGPLPDSALSSPPMAHRQTGATVNVVGWDLRAFDLTGGGVWALQKTQLPRGLSRPGGRAEMNETAGGGFTIRLVDG